MKIIKLVFLSVSLFACWQASSQMSFSSIDDQIDYFQGQFGHPSSNTQIVKNSYNSGDTRPKAILKGAFYIGGSDQKRQLLSSRFQQKLCRAGFSKVYSVYKKVDRTVSCSGNSYDYSHIREAREYSKRNDRVYNLLRNLHEVVTSNGSAPAIFLHCHYGVHASNVIAQMALMQFCGISKQQAKRNWDVIDLYDSLGAKGRAKQFRKIDNFSPYSEFQISEKVKNKICY